MATVIPKRLLRLVVLLILGHCWYLLWTSGWTDAVWLRRLDLALVDTVVRFSERPGNSNKERPVVLGLSRVDFRRFGAFPWPRDRWAEVIERLDEAGAKKIVLDVFFLSKSDSPKADARLEKAMGASGKVLLPVYSSILIQPDYLEGGGVNVGQIQLNEPRLQSAAQAVGHINAFLDVDEKIRFVPLYLKHTERTYYQLSLEALRQTEAARSLLSEIQIDKSWPGIFIDYRGFDNRFEFYSIGELLAGGIPPERLKNRVVFVGQTTQGLPFADIVSTPLGLRHGIFLLAAVADQIQSGRMPRQLRPLEVHAYFYALCLGSVLLAGWANQRLRILGLICAPAAVFLLHVAAFQERDILVPFGGSALAASLPMLIAFVTSDFYFRFSARRDLERAEKLAGVGRMTSMIAHDIRNPLAILLGHVQNLISSVGDPGHRNELEIVQRQARRINGMLQELLDYTSGRTQLDWAEVDFVEFVRDSCEQLRCDLCEPRKISIEVKCRVESGRATIDRNRLQRAFENLVKNAIEAMEEGGRIELMLDCDARSWLLRFKDNGAGIPEVVRRDLFHPFVTSGKKHGLGLGLAIVRQIVELHGGAVRIESTGPKGTVILVELPAGTSIRESTLPLGDPAR